MKLLTHLLNALIVLVALAASAIAAPRADHVFIISFDGGKPAVMKESAMPTLFEMVRQGATSWNAQTILPSITLVSHTSMLTGVQPARHQVVWNSWIPQRGLVKVPTVFKLARDSGYSTALFAGKEKLRHLNVPGSVDEFQLPSYRARNLARAAARHIVEKKPNLMFIHFADPDGAGHKYGWGSPEQKQSFVDTDAALNIVRNAVQAAGIASRSTFILSADHGGHDKTHGSKMLEDTTIPWIAWGAGVKPNFQITDAVSTCDTAATALWLLDVAVPADWDGKVVESAFAESKKK